MIKKQSQLIIILAALLIQGSQSISLNGKQKITGLTDEITNVGPASIQQKFKAQYDQNLLQMKSKGLSWSSFTTNKNGKENNPLAEFLFGIIFIIIAIPTIWMNERRQVKIGQVIDAAETSYIRADSEKVSDDLDFELVHVTAKTTTEETLEDNNFDLQIPKCLRLLRKVEMYQYQETKQEDKDNNRTTYCYNKDWFEFHIDSDLFQNSSHVNPKSMIYQSEEFIVKSAKLGQYHLQQDHIKRLNNIESFTPNEDQDHSIMMKTSISLEGYSVQRKDAYYYAKVDKLNDSMGRSPSYDIGDIRISWTIVPSEKDTTVMAQQIKDGDGMTTFRQWNPMRKDVPYGQDNGSSTESDCDGCASVCCCCSICCSCFMLVEKLFKAAFQETIDYITVENQDGPHVIKQLRSDNETTTTIFRWVAWILMVFGHFLLFSPIIALFKFIPLVGWLLGSIISFAAAIFSLLWGSMIHLLIMTAAWIRFRPLFGLLLLTGVAVIITVMFTTGKKA